MLLKHAVAITLVLQLAVVGRVAAGDQDFGRLNAQAPPETEQFAFLIGLWDCTRQSMQPDGQSYGKVNHATWAGRYILDGWAIQDDWVSKLPGGGTFYGTNIRSFNPQTGKWDNRWLPAGSLQWKYYEAEKVGDTMVMIGGEGKDARGTFIDRNVFHDIQPDSWKWRKDRSWDGGKTWIEDIARIVATRAR